MTLSLEWRNVLGYESSYRVSSDGNVWSLLTGKMLKLTKSNAGYVSVNLQGKTTRVHRIVALAFLGDSAEPHVRHLDGNPANNRVDNLAWGSIAENNRDIVRMGRHNNASKTHCKYGHAYTPENTYHRSRGRRECKICIRNRNRGLL